MAVKLSQAALGDLPGGVARPGYDRSSLTGGIVHIGLGNFHRAHQAIYLDRLFESGRNHDWAIIGASLRANDQAIRDDLEAQDWLTTVVELDPGVLSARVSGPMIDYVPIDPTAVREAMSDPAIRIVSLTITEGGYYVDATTGGFDKDHDDIRHDADHTDQPRTVFGCILSALRHRRDAGVAPFTIMSCDNLPENGHVARNSVLGLAAEQDAALADWVDTHVSFPNSMVDCITPATSQREIDMVADTFGVDDARPVACEPFRQWVMEDKFSAGRPALEHVGVEFVADVAPYELMKLRILNGGHAAIAYPAGLLGIHFVHDAMAHPLIAGFLEKLVRTEVITTVPPIEGVSYDDYLATVLTRFANPRIGDTIPRLCFDGSNRQPKFIIPTIEDRLNGGESLEGLALESALWCRYCHGVTEAGETIAPNDPDWNNLQKQAKAAQDNPSAWLAMEDVYGEVGGNGRFVDSFAQALNALRQDGVEATLQRYIDA